MRIVRYRPKPDSKEPDADDKGKASMPANPGANPKADKFLALRQAARAVKPMERDKSPAMLKAKRGAAAQFGGSK